MTGSWLVASSAGPSWHWYATRGLGVSTLVVLTAAVVLGILTARKWIGEATPGFVAADLHRNFSLLAIVLLIAHIVTTVLDPFAHITVRDVLIPVGAAYRPIWLGLGVVAFWILVGVGASSLLRDRVGLRTWRAIHWTAYASWPLSLVHGLGTGSDSRAPWLVAVVFASIAAVLIALFLRLREGRLATLPIRALGALAVIAFLAGAGAWAFGGPFQPGWAARAGTPPVKAAVAKPGPVHPGPEGFSDPLNGVLVRDSSGRVQISMRDTVDTGLTISIRSPNTNETLPVVTVARDGRVLCSVPANPGATLYAVCGTTRMTIAIYGADSATKTGGNISGRLETSGPLN